MQRKRINGDKDDPYQDAEKDIDEGNDEFFRVGPHLGQDGEGLPASLVLKLAKGEGHGMAKPIGEDGSPELLDDDIPEIVLEGLGDTGDHGYADQHAQEAHQAPDELGLSAGACLMKDLGVGVEITGLKGMGAEFVH